MESPSPGILILVQNLAIENFGVDSGTGGAAVLFTGTGATTDFVTGCYLGVGPSGSTVALNEYGVWVTNGASAGPDRFHRSRRCKRHRDQPGQCADQRGSGGHSRSREMTSGRLL